MGFLQALRQKATALTTRQALTCLLLAFVLSRLLAGWAGLRFDAQPLGSYFQYLDPELLRHDLLRSLLCLHMQPPLFNLGLGLVLKAFPEDFPVAFQVLYLACGLALHLGLFLLLVRLEIPRFASLLLTLLFMLSPACLLYENWLFYTYPLAAWLCLSALLLHRLLRAPTWGGGLLFFGALGAVALTRSLFHLGWFLFWAGFLLWAVKPSRKTLAWAAAFPLLLLVAWQAKNAVLFGSFTGSTWLGFNLSRITTFELPAAERRARVAAGELSHLALIRPFAPLSSYPACRGVPPDRPVPALDQEFKSTGCANYNHRDYIRLSRLYAQDAWRVLAARPRAYLDGVASAWLFFFIPSSDYELVAANREHILSWDRGFNRYVLGQLRGRDERTRAERSLEDVGAWLVLGYFAAGGGGLLFLRRARRGGVPLADPTFLTVLYLLLNVLYVAVAGNALEAGENNRFRFMIDPLALALLAWSVSQFARQFRAAAPRPS